MSEVTEEQLEAGTTAEGDDDFNSGFSDAPQLTETPASGEEEGTDSESKNSEDTETPETPPEETPEPELKTLTKAEYEELLNKASAIDRKADRTEIDKVFGKFGELNQIVRTLQAQTPRGAKIDISDDDFKELKEEYGDIADLTLTGLKRVLEKVSGTGIGGQPEAPAFDPAQFTQAEDRATLRAKAEIATETLDETHEGWREIVGLPDANGNIPQTEYRKWLATQPDTYQQRVIGAFNPVTIGRSIDRFNEEQKKAKAAADARQRRMAAAVTPKGTGGHEASGRAEEDDFDAGFNRG